MPLPSDLLLPTHHYIKQKQRKLLHSHNIRLSQRQGVKKPCGTSAQKAGMRYENRVGVKLEKLIKPYGAALHSHVWIDAGQSTYQLDYFVEFPSRAVLLFEVKHTWVNTTDQLGLYKELLEALGYSPVICCTICKNLTPNVPRGKLIYSLDLIEEDSIWQVRI